MVKRFGSSPSVSCSTSAARLRALDGEHREVRDPVGDGRVVAGCVALEPGEVGLVVARVRDGQEAVGAEPVREQVVEHAALLVAQHGVLRAVLGDLGDVVGEEPLEELLRSRPGRLDLAHVADVEHPGPLAHGHVLLADPAWVLHGHLPAGERNQPRPLGDVAVVQRGSLECLRPRSHRRRTLPPPLRPQLWCIPSVRGVSERRRRSRGRSGVGRDAHRPTRRRAGAARARGRAGGDVRRRELQGAGGGGCESRVGGRRTARWDPESRTPRHVRRATRSAPVRARSCSREARPQAGIAALLGCTPRYFRFEAPPGTAISRLTDLAPRSDGQGRRRSRSGTSSPQTDDGDLVV